MVADTSVMGNLTNAARKRMSRNIIMMDDERRNSFTSDIQ